MATFEGTRSPKCCPWTNQGYLTFPHTPPWPRPDPREAYTRAYPNRVGPADLTLEGPECAVIFRIHDSPRAEFLTVRVVVVPVWMAVTSDRSDSHARGLVIC